MQDPTATSPQTPIRVSRVPAPNRTESSGIRITTPVADNTPTPGDQHEAQLRQQLLQMQRQITTLSNSINTSQNQNMGIAAKQYISREYWSLPIDKSIKYPGKDASQNAKTAYLQRLDSYIAKSTPIWDLISGKLQCPIATNAQAITVLKPVFGILWKFEPKDIKKSLHVLQRDSPDLHANVLERMNEGSESIAGSWNQRNAALYSIICDTLDLSKNGGDLDFLEVVDEGNGLALYNLTRFRLREIKSSDPLARAIKLQMGLHHIKYVPKRHGVAKYFAKIESHRSELASLPKPKIINDWEVTAKALRELPLLHPKFKSVADVLQIQRTILKTETTLEECRKAFVSADVDNDIGGDLHAKSQTSAKRKLKTNLSQTDKRRNTDSTNPRRGGKYKPGDCVHHPRSTTHLSRHCTNPFGIRSIFGSAVSYADKCAAVKTSVATGWSPRATNVQIPQGYGCDTPNHNQNTTVPPPTPIRGNNPTRPLTINNATMPAPLPSVYPHQHPMYHRAQPPLSPLHAHASLSPRHAYHHHHLQPQTGPPHPHAHHHYNPNYPYGSPLRAFHTAPRQPLGHPATSTLLSPPAPVRTHRPAPIRPNTAPMMHDYFPQPTQDDLIAAGMRYYSTQTGPQDFQ